MLCKEVEYLLQWISCFTAGSTFILGARKHASSFARWLCLDTRKIRYYMRCWSIQILQHELTVSSIYLPALELTDQLPLQLQQNYIHNHKRINIQILNFLNINIRIKWHTWQKVLVEISWLLVELLKVRLAVQNTFHWRVAAQLFSNNNNKLAHKITKHIIKVGVG